MPPLHAPAPRADAESPGARGVDIPGHGDLVHEEATEKIAPLIRAFLALHHPAEAQ